MSNNELPKGIKSKLDKYERKGHRPRVYTCGSFDLMNHGTVSLLKKVKSLIPNCELMVGIYSDDDILSKKGMNVLNESERLKGVQFCKYVDLIYFPAPWKHELDFFEENEIDFVTGEINGWDLDLLQNDEEITEFNPCNQVSKPRLLQEEQSETMKQLEKGLSLRVYAKSQFNYLKQKIFNLPSYKNSSNLAGKNSPNNSDGSFDTDPLIQSSTRSNNHPIPLDDTLPNGQDILQEGVLENTKSIHSNDRENSMKTAKTNSQILKSATYNNISNMKDSVKLDLQSLEYIESAKNILSELSSNDMYIPLQVEKRTGASELIIRILRERNAFYERSIKQGYSRQDLNLSVYDYYKFKLKIWFISLCK